MHAIKTLSAAALALTAGLATAPAQASDVRWSVHIGLPVVTLPFPVVPVPVPVPVARPAPVLVYAAPAWRDRDRDGIPDWRDPYDNRRGYAHRRHRGPDRDRDGIPDWRDPRDNRRDDWRDDWRDQWRNGGPRRD